MLQRTPVPGREYFAAPVKQKQQRWENAMNQDSEKWLDDRISEDVVRMAEKRKKQLMESEELKDINASSEALEKLKQRLAEMNGEEEKIHRPRIRLRVALAAALVAVLMLGVGIVGSGKKVYLPVVSQREDGAEKTTKVNNDQTNVASGYDEEEVCQEIEEKLGVLPVRFGYRPEGMVLKDFWVDEDAGETVVNYSCNKNDLYVYISKDIATASAYYKMDGNVKENIHIDSLGADIKICTYSDSDNNMYYQSSFEYLNTYYSIAGMFDIEEFKKILENIIIKNI